MSSITCNFLADSLVLDLTSNLLILGLNLVIAVYNVAHSGRSIFSKLSGWREYVLLLLLPLFHSLLAPLFWEFYKKEKSSENVLVLKPLMSWLNAVGLRAFIKVLKLGCGGPRVIQDSLELITLADGYVKMGCPSAMCPAFRSLWILFVWMDWITYLLFLQPFLVMLQLFRELSSTLSYMVVTVEVLVSVVALCAAWKMLFILHHMCYLPRKKMKMGYISVLVLSTQVKFNILATMIRENECQDSNEESCCDFKSSIQGLFYMTAFEMIIIGLLGAICFPISDLMLLRTDLLEISSRSNFNSGHARSESNADEGFLSVGGVIALTQTLKMLNNYPEEQEEKKICSKSVGLSCKSCNQVASPPSQSQNTDHQLLRSTQSEPVKSKVMVKHQVLEFALTNDVILDGSSQTRSKMRENNRSSLHLQPVLRNVAFPVQNDRVLDGLGPQFPHSSGGVRPVRSINRIRLSDVLSDDNVSKLNEMSHRVNSNRTSGVKEECKPNEIKIPSDRVAKLSSTPLSEDVMGTSDEITMSNAAEEKPVDDESNESWLTRGRPKAFFKSEEDCLSRRNPDRRTLRSRSVGCTPLGRHVVENTGEKSFTQEVSFQ